MSAGPDYAGEFRRLITQNASSVLNALCVREDWLMKKIAKAADRYGLSETEIISALRQCNVLRFYFAKDPARQSMHENVAAEFIRAIPGVTEFAQMKSEVKYIVDGRVVDKMELRALCAKNKNSNPTKELDFKWKFDGRLFYAYHKHTGMEGGMQGSQYNDLKTFAREAAKNDIPRVTFIALCDGPFYSGKNGIAGMSRADALRDIASNAKRENVFAMTTAELPEFLRRRKFGKASVSEKRSGIAKLRRLPE